MPIATTLIFTLFILDHPIFFLFSFSLSHHTIMGLFGKLKPHNPYPSPPEKPQPVFDTSLQESLSRPPLRIINSWPSISRDDNCTSPISTTSSSHSHQSIPQRSISAAPSARFVVYPDGSHTHSIKCMGPSRFTTSLHNLTHLLPSKSLKLPSFREKKNAEELKKERTVVNAHLQRPIMDNCCVATKWGTCHQVIGKGTFGIVRVVYKGDHPSSPNDQYAVKVRRKEEEAGCMHALSLFYTHIVLSGISKKRLRIH